MAFAYAPFGWGWLPLLLLQPLLAASMHPDANTRIWRGWLFGLGYFPVGAWWFAETLTVHLGYGWLGALGGHLLITGACALAPTVFCWLAGYMRLRPTQWAVAVSLLWVLIEDLRFQAFGGGPWMSLGLSQVDTPLAGFYPVLGELGTSFFVCLLAVLLAQWLRDRFKAQLWTLGIVTACVVLTGTGLRYINWTQPVGSPQPIALVQTAVTQQQKQNREAEAERLAQLAALSRPFLGSARFIIWPETVVTLDRQDVNGLLAQLQNEAMFARSTILVGAYQPTMTGQRFNTAYTLGYEAGQTYYKRHLVPFGEYVPDFLEFVSGHVPGDSQRGHGRASSLIANSGVLYGITICWEGSFSRDVLPLVRNGAHVIVNVANEAWFAGSTLPPQNLDAMRVRAMESGRDTVRVANFGPGAIINHRGEITHRLAALQADAIAGVLQPRRGATPFASVGADFISLLALLCLAGLLIRARLYSSTTTD